MSQGCGEYRICPRCKRPTNGWLLARGDACSVDYAVFCIREPRPEWPRADPQPIEWVWRQLPTRAVFHLVTDASDRARCGRLVQRAIRTDVLVGHGCSGCNAAITRAAAWEPVQ